MHCKSTQGTCSPDTSGKSNASTPASVANSTACDSTALPTKLSSTCPAEVNASNTIQHSNLTTLSYTKQCLTYLDAKKYNVSVLFVAWARSFDECITTCDTYNYWQKTKNMTTVVWNWGGDDNLSVGTCWCYDVLYGAGWKLYVERCGWPGRCEADRCLRDGVGDRRELKHFHYDGGSLALQSIRQSPEW